jgi:hypothetical protein
MVAKKTKQVAQCVYAYPYAPYYFSPWRRHWRYFYNSVFLQGYQVNDIPYKQVTLTANTIGAKNHRRVWQGVAQKELNSRNFSTEEGQAAVNSIFKKLHLPANSQSYPAIAGHVELLNGTPIIE